MMVMRSLGDTDVAQDERQDPHPYRAEADDEQSSGKFYVNRALH